jgi:hypothetical protein
LFPFPLPYIWFSCTVTIFLCNLNIFPPLTSTFSWTKFIFLEDGSSPFLRNVATKPYLHRVRTQKTIANCGYLYIWQICTHHVSLLYRGLNSPSTYVNGLHTQTTYATYTHTYRHIHTCVRRAPMRAQMYSLQYVHV